MTPAQKLIETIAEGYFAVGDVLQSNVSAQGMLKGQQYTVIDVFKGPFGTVQYEVSDTMGKTLTIGNAHILMKKVS